MRISPLTETDTVGLGAIATNLQTYKVSVHITTTELSYALGVSQDTIKRRLNRERQAWADYVNHSDVEHPTWKADDLPEPIWDGWLTRAAEWDLVVVLRWLAQRPMRRQV